MCFIEPSTDIKSIVKDFEKGVKLTETKKQVEERYKLSPTQEIQRFLAHFTAMLLLVFLLIPCMFLASGIISFSQTIDFLTTVMAILGPITGAVWGFYFQSIK